MYMNFNKLYLNVLIQKIHTAKTSVVEQYIHINNRYVTTIRNPHTINF